MDWFTILLFLIFFIFPLIQQVLEAKKGKAPRIPSEDVEGLPPEWEPEPIPRQAEKRPTDAPIVLEERDWSAGWAKWPQAESAETLESEERASFDAPVERPAPPIFVSSAPPPRPAVPRVSTRVTAAERTRRAAERLEVVRLQPVSARTVHGRALRDTSGKAALRQAIILKEILDPPKSMRLRPEDS